MKQTYIRKQENQRHKDIERVQAGCAMMQATFHLMGY